MASMATISPPFSLLLLSLLLLSSAATARKTYIVHMKHHAKPQHFTSHHDWYSDSLQSLSSTAGDSLLYSYTAAFPGFAASLDPDEAQSLRNFQGVLDVYEDTLYSLHTTRTPEFLGLNADLGLFNGRHTFDIDQASHDVVIGVLDTGIWPESKSFDDAGMPEIPSYRMATGGSYLKKAKEIESPRDVEGHGTHTASTAAGSQVGNASLLGYASGTARGMATHARVASYKVCWTTGCFGSDILAGMDRAISDGVDVLSLSLGGGSGPYYRDTIAIGAFTAMERGIFVSCSAGNSGPTRATLANVAPWIMTVGAGTLDRDFPAYAVLGNNKKFTGVSLYSGTGMGDKAVPVVYDKGNTSSNLCLPGSLQPSIVRGKVVICDRGINARVEKGAVVRDAGGIGMILANTAVSGEELVADSHLLPAVAVGRKAGDVIREYVSNDANPTAVLSFGGTVLNIKPSPVVAAFSSRGPNMVTPQIMKPDLIGPGVNILAAWSEAVGPTGLESDTRKTKFNIMSGTSMSCPHISGVAALLKAAHPSWSPSAIKSALMTTAYVVDNTNSPLSDAGSDSSALSNPWAHGSGHVDPQKAISPGLVYDISTHEYILFLCSIGYSVDHVALIVKRPNVTCTRKFTDPGHLNYPSFSILFDRKRVVRYTRELTNVGEAGSVYDVAVTGPSTVGITVKPNRLVFKNVGDKLKYTVTFVAKKDSLQSERYGFGSLVWRNAQHQVKSPVSFAWTQLM
ncbi:Subtilase family protein [Euphorbia peplus]|nr:Subtilase family protein [Euphorbia peplus]